jgi:hypothetical protein
MQQTVTVPVEAVEHAFPLWEMAIAGGVVLLALLFLALVVVMALASFRRKRLNED